MEVKFLEPETIYSIIAWRFPVWYFFVSFWVNRCVFLLSDLLWALLLLLSYSLSIRSAFSLFFFCQKSFVFFFFFFFCIRLLVCFGVISQLLIAFSFVVWNALFCFTLCWYLFNLPSFTSIFPVYFLKLYWNFYLCFIFLIVLTHSSVFPLFYHFGLFS